MQKYAIKRTPVRQSKKMLSSKTYGHGDFGATNIVRGDVSTAGNLPFLFLGLVLSSGTSVDFDSVLVVDLDLGIEGHLVVGEGPGGGETTLVLNLQLVGGLVDVRAGTVLVSLRLHVPLSVKAL